jgi:hypothetical protein
MKKDRANNYAVQHGTRPLDSAAMSFDWGVSSGHTRYDNEPTRLEAGFNELYDLFGYLEASHSWHGRVRNVWYKGRILMPVDVIMNEFEGPADFDAWALYALLEYRATAR